ncbi:MAG: uroporphyrinogen-III synthase [Chloroflexi bacterium]|nr:uroporphyrinogen-III synthase [Chloroflexota bacterium]
MSEALQNRRVVVTRSVDQAAALVAELEHLGAIPLVVPAIQFVPLPTDQLDDALRRITSYDWLIFTSANAVRFFYDYVDTLATASPLPKLAAIGDATADLLSSRNREPDFVPSQFVGEQLVQGLGELLGARVLLPRSRIGRPEIVELLRTCGAQVDDIALYDTVTAPPHPAMLADLGQGFDAITFTSPSSVRNFLKIIGDMPDLREQLDKAAIACIGPTTAATAQENDLAVSVMPEVYTIAGLTQALANYYHLQPMLT